ncbi:MAG: hypothetical protein WBH00_02605 [Xanthobacteraceae bacterium]
MEMEVDHVMPEQLLSDPLALAKLKLEMGLTSAFNVLGYENLGPSCRDCNGKKHGRPFPAGYGSIVLGKIAEKLPALQEAIDRKRQDRDLDNTLRHIARSLDSGRFSHEDLLKGIDILRKFPNGISGSSPSARPASPELREANIQFSSVSRLHWMPEAKAAMSENGYSADRVNNMIYHAVMDGLLAAKRIAGVTAPTYRLRIAPDLRVVFTVTEDTVHVVSVHRKRSI